MISTELKKLVDPKNECCCEYHLAHKCKELAYKKGYSLVSGVFIVADDNGNAVFDYFNYCLINYIEKENRKQVLNNFKSDTEAEAIFKSCEWILKEEI